MSFSPCLLIPIYNHGAAIRGTVRRLAGYGLPILIVDDGSDDATQAALAALAADFPQMRLFRLPQNEGKGGAVMRGLREARRAGFSHALQIDADGQHDAADVPRFLALGAAHPAALICGKPVYEGKKNFYCSDRSCQFVLWKDDRFWTSRKKELTKKMAGDLLKKGRTSVKGMWSEKKGASYDAVVVLDDTGGKYVRFKLEFPKRKEGVNGKK